MGKSAPGKRSVTKPFRKKRRGNIAEWRKAQTLRRKQLLQVVEKRNTDSSVTDLFPKKTEIVKSARLPEIINYPYFDELTNFILDILPEADTDKKDVAYMFVDPGGMTHCIHNLYVYDATPSSQIHIIVKCIQKLCPARAVILNNKFHLTVCHNHKADIMDVLMAKLAALLKNRSACEPNLTVEEIIDQELMKYEGLKEYIGNNMPVLKGEMDLARGIEPVFDPYVYSLEFGTTAEILGTGENDIIKIEDILLLLKEAKCIRKTLLISDMIKTEPIENCPVGTKAAENPTNIARENSDTWKKTEDSKKRKTKKSSTLIPSLITDQVATVIEEASSLPIPRHGNLPSKFTLGTLQNVITFYSVNNRVPEIATAIKHFVFNRASAKGSKVSPASTPTVSTPYGTAPGLSNSDVYVNGVEIKIESEQIVEDEYHGVMIPQEILPVTKMEEDNNFDFAMTSAASSSIEKHL